MGQKIYLAAKFARKQKGQARCGGLTKIELIAFLQLETFLSHS